ncbi:ribosomal-protein-alanine N-acetyltransferase [compost metagenome]
MKIKKLQSFSVEDQKVLGTFGYTSYFKYEVNKEETSEKLSIYVEKQALERPYIKLYKEDLEDDERYERIIPLGFSLGGFLDNKLIAVAICEPIYWNNTLKIWHFQVNENYRRMKTGKALMENIIDLANSEGFRAVVLETQNTNAPAVDFYKQCGFELDGIDVSFYTNNDLNDGEVAFFMKKRTSMDL